MLTRYTKVALERLFVRAGLLRMWKRLAQRNQTILAYHDVMADETAIGGDSSLHVSRRQFASQLDMLCQTHDVVSLQSMLETRTGSSGRPQVAITFDDAYRGAVTRGVEELERRGLPATIFVTPMLLGTPSFWWDDVVGPGEAELAAPIRERLLNELRGDDELIRTWAAESGVELHSESHASGPATAEQLRAALRYPRLTLGSHSMSHRNLARLTELELQEEIAGSLAWLRERFDRVIAWFSYPYGLASPEAEVQVQGAGYDAAVLNCGGPLPRRLERRFALPRANVPAGLSLDGLALRAAGFGTR